MSPSAARVVSAVGFDHIVLYKRSSRPTVQSDQTVVIGIYGSGVVDGTAQKSVEFLVGQRSTYRAAPVAQPMPATTSVLALVHWRL